MLAGHFASAAILKGADNRVPLWVLLVAVQFVDIFCMIFVLLGWERMDVVHGFTAVNDLDMFMPYTHSLIMTPLWAALGAGLYKLYDKTADNKSLLIVAIAVAGHWVLDLLVHVPDLPLFFSEDVKFGFGLWHFKFITIALESAMVVAAYMIYRRSSEAQISNRAMFYAVFGLMAFFAAHQLVFHIPTGDTTGTAITGLFVFLLLPVLAYFAEKRVTA